jgi:hypothetical protein
MSFIIRQISRTAEGREIIRPTTVQGDVITVGRDAASDIHLADLAVDLHHATISRLSTGKVKIESTSGLAFESDGRATKLAEFDPAKGGELGFGGHRLTVSAEGESVIIAVERVGALSDSASEKEEIGLFTLKGLLPGRRASAWGFIVAVLLAFLAWPIYSFATSHGVKDRGPGFHADTMWTSGPLSDAHKSLSNNCQACHTDKFVAVQDSSCLTCHKDDAHDHADMARIARAKEVPGMGGQITGWFKAKFNKPEGCVDCHTEHEGAGRMAPTAQAFCTDCHGSLNQRLTDTKLKNAGDFGTVHPNFQPAITAGFESGQRLVKRVSFEMKPTEDNGLKFPHAMHLSHTNGVTRMVQTMASRQGWGATLACKDCHTPTADGTRFKPIEMEERCEMCHSLAFDQIGGTLRTLRHGQPAQVVADLRAYFRSTLPSRPISLSGMARRRPGDYAAGETANDYVVGARVWRGGAESAINAVFTKGGACYDCHTVTRDSRVAGGWHIARVLQPSRYMLKGWFDHNAHTSETCSSCHKAEMSKSATDLLLPDVNSCRDCHVGESGASLKHVSKPVNSSCAMCHDYHIDPGAPWLSRKKVNRTKPDSEPPPRVASLP